MTSPLPASANRAFFLRLAGTLLTLLLLIYLLSRQGWGEIGEAIRQIPLWRFALALGLMMVSRLAVSGRWHVLLRAVELDISPGQTIRLTFAGLFASNFLPTTIGGDVVRLAGAIQLKFDAAICTASLVVDRLVGMAGMAMALPFGIPSFLAGKFIEGSSHLPDSLKSGFALPAAGKWSKLLKERTKSLLQKLIRAISRWVKQPGALLFALALSWVHMLCLFGSILILLNGMGETISFWSVAGLWSVVYFVTLVPISINGYGLQEVSMAFLFSNVGGVSHQSGLTIAILIRTITMLASLPGAAFVPGIMAGRNATSRNISPTQTVSESPIEDPGGLRK
jgi:uncharacterized membrane protein YbhN (UPF0104 family)